MKLKLVERLKCTLTEITLLQSSAVNWHCSYREWNVDLKRKFISKDLGIKSWRYKTHRLLWRLIITKSVPYKSEDVTW